MHARGQLVGRRGYGWTKTISRAWASQRAGVPPCAMSSRSGPPHSEMGCTANATTQQSTRSTFRFGGAATAAARCAARWTKMQKRWGTCRLRSKKWAESPSTTCGSPRLAGASRRWASLPCGCRSLARGTRWSASTARPHPLQWPRTPGSIEGSILLAQQALIPGGPALIQLSTSTRRSPRHRPQARRTQCC